MLASLVLLERLPAWPAPENGPCDGLHVTPPLDVPTLGTKPAHPPDIARLRVQLDHRRSASLDYEKDLHRRPASLAALQAHLGMASAVGLLDAQALSRSGALQPSSGPVPRASVCNEFRVQFKTLHMPVHFHQQVQGHKQMKTKLQFDFCLEEE